MMSKKILVTGSGGFLGGHMAGLWEAAGNRVLRVGRNTGFFEAGVEGMADWFERERPDWVVHAAGGSSVGEAVENPRRDFESGPLLLEGLLEGIRRGWPEARIVFLSSAAVYGQPEKLPVDEETACEPISAYGYHKRLSELLIEQYARVHGVRGASARIFSAYGKGLRKQVLWDLCVRSRSAGDELIVQGTGKETRDFIEAADVALGVSLILKNGSLVGEAYNLAGGREIEIGWLAQQILSRIAPHKVLRFSGEIPEGVPKCWRADMRRLRELGFVPEIHFERGLENYLDWFEGGAS